MITEEIKPPLTPLQMVEHLNMKNLRSLQHAVRVKKLPPGDVPAGRGYQYSHDLASKILSGTWQPESK